jgi:hypothetical protein
MEILRHKPISHVKNAAALAAVAGGSIPGLAATPVLASFLPLLNGHLRFEKLF